MVLLRGADDRGSLHVFPFDGRDFYLTEFVEFADEKGLYHKQRIVVIDGEPFIRHSLYDASWKVNSASVPYMRDRESWEDTLARMHRLEEESLPMLRPAIQEITRRLELEYFGIDCCILPSGELLVFEANANMNVLYNPYPEMNDRLGRIHARIYAMLAAHSGEHIA
jgi:hypothetical protein